VVGEEGDVEGLNGGELTERRFRLSSRWRGTTVTISISQRKATSTGVRPACRGNAIIISGLCLVLKIFHAGRDLTKETRPGLMP
jgi:hypothetical protein